MTAKAEIKKVVEVIDIGKSSAERMDVVGMTRLNCQSALFAFSVRPFKQLRVRRFRRPSNLLNALARKVKSAANFFICFALNEEAHHF